MNAFFSRHRRVIFGAVAAVFLVGIFVGLGAYMFTGSAASSSPRSTGSWPA